MSVPPGRSLASVLRSTLTLVDYYGEQRGYDSLLRELKLVITRTIHELEEDAKSSSSDGSAPDGSGPKQAKPDQHPRSGKLA